MKHYVNGLIVGNIGAIHIPACGEQTVTAEWTVPTEMTLIQMASHQHRLGTYANIELVRARRNAGAALREHRLGAPGVVLAERGKGLALTKGDKMRITCQLEEHRRPRSPFGPETTDEMCFILGFYYRDERQRADRVDDVPAVADGHPLPAAARRRHRVS